MNNTQKNIIQKVNEATSKLIVEKGYISIIDVLMELKYLSKEDYEKWRFKKVHFLEKVIKINLNKINFIMKSIRENSLNGKLKPSKTVYKSWGKGEKRLLRFSKSGDPNIEEAYSTHFVKPSTG